MILNKICKIILIMPLILTGFNTQAQGSYYNQFAKRHTQYMSFGVSTASYFGDLHRRIFVPHGGLTFQFNQYIGPQVNFRAALNLYAIRGDDNTGQHDLEFRQLSFEAYNAEFSSGFEFSFIPVFESKKRPVFNPYLFLSVGVSTNNPRVNYEGKSYNLRKLRTEGVRYPGLVPVVPLGGGIRIRLLDYFNIITEWGYRFAFTDYLDDVSTVYPDPEILKTDIARTLSNRTDITGASPGKIGGQRGNPRENDSYLIWSIRIEGKISELLNPRRKWRR